MIFFILGEKNNIKKMRETKMAIKKVFSRKYSGLSLMELMLYIAIMSILVLTSMAVAVSYINGRRNIKTYQQNVEEMSLVINDMAKKLRMSNCGEDEDECTMPEGESNSIGAIDNVSKLSFGYTFDNSSLELRDRDGNVVLDKVEGSFVVAHSPNSSGGGIPLITIKIWKDGKPETLIQTSVSQRSGYMIDTTP